MRGIIFKRKLLSVSKMCSRSMYFTNDKNETDSLNSSVSVVLFVFQNRVSYRFLTVLKLSSLLSLYKADCYKANKTSSD